MGYKPKLQKPKNLKINFKPSERQYEVWNLLSDRCHVCGGEIVYEIVGKDLNGNDQEEPVCSNCGEKNTPQMILTGGAAGC